jgi:hypothetical protein
MVNNIKADEKMFSLVRDGYTQSEFIHVELDKWKFMLTEMYKYKRLARLPKEWVDDLPDGEFHIYRGGTPDGFSWSLTKNVAKWFATRFKIIGIADKVYTMLVTKAEVLWYTDARNEQEVVLIPDQKKVEEAK